MDMTLPELMQFLDTAARCRDRTYRNNVMYNLNKFYPNHGFTVKVTKLHWSGATDKEFRAAVRKEVKAIGIQNP